MVALALTVLWLVLMPISDVQQPGRAWQCNQQRIVVQDAVVAYHQRTGQYPDAKGNTNLPLSGDPVAISELLSAHLLTAAPSFNFIFSGSAYNITPTNAPMSC